MTLGGERAATERDVGVIRRSLAGRAALWTGFVLVHLALIWLNLYGQGYPLGDVSFVYRVWAENATDGLVRMGIDVPWVYPILAFAPMTAALALGVEWYGHTWLAIVSVLDAIAFSILVGNARLSRSRRIAAWWWVGFLAVLGPIALGRIDAITVPLAITGLLFAAGRPRVAAVLLTVGAWVEGVAGGARRRPRHRRSQARRGRHRRRGAERRHPRGERRGRGRGERHRLRRRAGGPRPADRGAARHGLALADRGGIEGRHGRVRPRHPHLPDRRAGSGCRRRPHDPTHARRGGDRRRCSGVRAAARRAHLGELLAPLSLGFVVVLMVANKVGSPQFATWLAAPIILGLVYRPARFAVPAALAAAVALLTHIIYPYWYGWLLIANPAFVFLLTVKSALLIALLVWSLHAVWQAGSRKPGS